MSEFITCVVVIPVYNEAEAIEKTLDAVIARKPDFAEKGIELKVFVVDDGSSDNSGRLARGAGVDKVLAHKVNRGLGAAIRTGLVAAKNEKVDMLIKFDADLQHDPDDMLKMVEPLLADRADVVYGQRFDKIEYKMPFIRRMGNIVFTRLMKMLTGWPLKDSQPGIFAVNKKYLEDFYLPGDYNYTQQILLDAYHKGMRFEHVPVLFKKRISGGSFVTLKYPFKVLPQIVQVLVGVKPLLVFGSISILFFGVGGFVAIENILEWIFGASTKPIGNVNLVLGCAFFGVQSLSFGLLADLIVRTIRPR